MQQQFFQQFFMQQEQPQQQPAYMFNNDVVHEIANNWDYVKALLQKHKEGKLTQVDEMEQVWFNYIFGNNINFESFISVEEFVTTCLKVPKALENNS